jgi:hypothetical protein
VGRDNNDIADRQASPPLHFSGEGETGRRKEDNNGHDIHEVGFRYGIALGGVIASVRKSPISARLFGLCGRLHDCPGFIF